MILVAVHMNNPTDVPGRITLEFEKQEQCEKVLNTMTYWLKFDSFKVEGHCKRK